MFRIEREVFWQGIPLAYSAAYRRGEAEHLAMLETGHESDATDGWFEHVTDEDYNNATEV